MNDQRNSTAHREREEEAQVLARGQPQQTNESEKTYILLGSDKDRLPKILQYFLDDLYESEDQQERALLRKPIQQVTVMIYLEPEGK